jgi:hypothetical protein
MRASQLGSLRLGYRWPTSSDERDGRPVYGMGGLDGLGGRAGGQESTSGDWDGLGGGEPQPCQGEGRGFESRRPLHIRPAQRIFPDGREPFTIALDYTIAL